MKLIIQIPCFNEEATISQTIKDIPVSIEGVSEIEVLVIDDGSEDKTVEIAKQLGVKHIITLKRNMGLGIAFKEGLKKCQKLGADIVINFDADNQYQGKYINDLVLNLIKFNNDIVIGSRQYNKIKHFNIIKKILQKIGSKVVQIISGQKISDATSGFRAYSKDAVNRLFVSSKFSYTLDTLIQAFDKNLLIDEVPIKINKPTRPSRLFKSNFEYIFKQLGIILKAFLYYKPLHFFFFLSIVPLICGFYSFIRFLIFYFQGQQSGHVQSLIFGSTSLVMGIILIGIGILGVLIKNVRNILENNKD